MRSRASDALLTRAGVENQYHIRSTASRRQLTARTMSTFLHIRNCFHCAQESAALLTSLSLSRRRNDWFHSKSWIVSSPVSRMIHSSGYAPDCDSISAELLSLHRGQGLELLWRDSLQCPTEEEYVAMVNNSECPYFGRRVCTLRTPPQRRAVYFA